MGYQQSALKGFSWQTLLKIIGNGLVLLKMMLLARLLAPDAPADFGVFSLVMIALGLSESVTQTGVNITILQSKRSVAYFLDTAWVIAITRGFLIGIVMILMGWGMSKWYQQPELFYLVGLAALIPVVKGFINPAIVSWYKSLHFTADSVYRLALLVAETLLVIGLVWWQRTVTAWVLALLGTAVFEVIISFAYLNIRPTFRFVSSRAQEIFQQAKGFSVASVLAYLNDNVDNLLIGTLAGTYGLGLYQSTYGLTHEANYEISKSVHHGTLPVYTKIYEDPQRLQRAILKSFGFGLGLATLGSLPFLFVPELIVTIVFGDQWLPAVELVRWLTLAGWLHAVMTLAYTVLIATKKIKLMNLHSLLLFVLTVVAILIGGKTGGLTGAVIGLATARLLMTPLVLWFVKAAIENKYA